MNDNTLNKSRKINRGIVNEISKNTEPSNTHSNIAYNFTPTINSTFIDTNNYKTIKHYNIIKPKSTIINIPAVINLNKSIITNLQPTDHKSF